LPESSLDHAQAIERRALCVLCVGWDWGRQSTRIVGADIIMACVGKRGSFLVEEIPKVVYY
jgi:hypothetical protein